MGEDVTEQKLLKKGAEASLFLADWHDKRVVIKNPFTQKISSRKT